MAMELKTKNQWLALQTNGFPLPGVPNVEVVLRHFHRSPSGAGRLSVIPYVHRRTELYCAQACLA
jgi:hypothetical protein